MKKLISLVLALVLVLSLSTVAFADAYTPIDPDDFTFTKKYAPTEGETAPTSFPVETLTFAVENGANNPDGTTITIKPVKTNGTAENTITVELDTYSNVGIWTYIIKEESSDTQGVKYDETEYTLTVKVTRDTTTNVLSYSIGLKDEDGNKPADMDNTFDAGSLTVSKKVAGNLASEDQLFNFTVEFTATSPVRNEVTFGDDNTVVDFGESGLTATVPLSIKHNGQVVFHNLPEGVSYTVTESAEHMAEDKTNGNNATGYTVTAEGEIWTEENPNIVSGSIAASDTDKAAFTNTKGTSVDTGVELDSVPYIVLMVAAVLGMGVMLTKKRAY